MLVVAIGPCVEEPVILRELIVAIGANNPENVLDVQFRFCIVLYVLDSFKIVASVTLRVLEVTLINVLFPLLKSVHQMLPVLTFVILLGPCEDAPAIKFVTFTVPNEEFVIIVF